MNTQETPDPLSVALALVAPADDADAGQALRDVVAGVIDTGRPGKLVVQIDVKPVPEMEGAIALTATPKPNVPTRPRQGRIAWAGPGGALTTSDPNAIPMLRDLREVPTDTPKETR